MVYHSLRQGDGEGQGREGEMKNFSCDLLSLRCLWDIQVEVFRSQLNL